VLQFLIVLFLQSTKDRPIAKQQQFRVISISTNEIDKTPHKRPSKMTREEPTTNGAVHEVKKSYNFATRAVHAGSPHDPVTGAVIEPVSIHVF